MCRVRVEYYARRVIRRIESRRDRRATHTRMSAREKDGKGAYRSRTCCVCTPARGGRWIAMNTIHCETMSLRLLFLRTGSLRTRVPIRPRRTVTRDYSRCGRSVHAYLDVVSQVVVDGQRGAGRRLVVRVAGKPNLSHDHYFRLGLPTKVREISLA